MRMQMKATSFIANTRRGQVDVTLGGYHQGEVVKVTMQFPVNADAKLTTEQLLDAAWLRAQQILRCATLVAQPLGRLGAVERPPTVQAKPIRLSLVPPVVPVHIDPPLHAGLWF